MSTLPLYPFAAIVGQENLKLALILNIIDPTIGGVLIRGKRGRPNPLPYAVLQISFR